MVKVFMPRRNMAEVHAYAQTPDKGIALLRAHIHVQT